MMAMKMTRTRGGSMPVSRPETILPGPLWGRAAPALATQPWMAVTGIK